MQPFTTRLSIGGVAALHALLCLGALASCSGPAHVYEEVSGPGAGTTATAIDPDLGEDCRLDGVWRLAVAIPVTWEGTVGVQAGRGEVKQIARVTRRTVEGGKVEENIVPCGIEVPAMKTTIGPIEHYQLVFDTETFDDPSSAITPATATTTFQPAPQVGATFLSTWATSELGIALDDPLNDPWPEDQEDRRDFARPVRATNDGVVGLPATPLTGDGFVRPPLGLTRKVRAGKLYFAIRNVERIMGRIVTCDELTGAVEVKEGATEDHLFFLDSSVVAADDPEGGRCAPGRADFIDSMLPRLEAAGPGTLHMRRVADDATCALLRADAS